LQVGNAERQNRLDDAAKLVDDDAIPAADRAIDAAKQAQPESGWGRGKRDELLAAMVDRRDELPKYATALRGQDLEQLLASVEKQIAIEKRAMTVAQSIKDGPR
jgi:hypothetical protein